MTEVLSAPESKPVAAEQTTPPAAPEKLLEPAIVDTLRTIGDRDTMDVYGPRLRGTSQLKTRAATMAGLPALGLGLMSETVGFGPQTFIVGGQTVAIAGTTIATLMYAMQRRAEKGRSLSAEQAQVVVRNRLAEPVDVIRDKHRGHSLSVRWYGADQGYDDSHGVGTVDRFAKVIDFAEAYGAAEVVVSADILRYGDEAVLKGKYKDALTTTSAFFVDKKGVRITDRHADDAIAKLTPAQARGLLGELNTQTNRTDAIAKWLIELHPEHPLVASYADWERLGRPAKLRPNLAQIMRASLDRHFGGSSLSPRIKLPIRDPTGNVVSHVKVGVGTSVMVGPDGITQLSAPQVHSRDGQETDMTEQKFSAIVGSSLNEFVDKLLALKDPETPNKEEELRLAEEYKTLPPHERWELEPKQQGTELPSHEQWKLELALYYLLQQSEKQPPATAKARIGRSQKELQTGTLYERMVQERPHTKFLGVGLRARGTVPKAEQTIEYGRLFLRNTAKKVAAVALLGVIGGSAAGYGWGQAMGTYEINDNWCEPSDNPLSEEGQLQVPEPTDEEKRHIDEYCGSSEADFIAVLGKSAEAVYDGNATYEDYLLVKAYELGILTPDNLEFFKPVVSQEWAQERADDLSQRYNLYGSAFGRDKSVVGDVDVNKNPALWSLNPLNGASTKGYWPTDVHSHITIEPSLHSVGDEKLPPLADASVSFDNPPQQSVLLPIGTKVPAEKQDQITFIRPLSIPVMPDDMTKQLISVSSRLLTRGNSQARFALGDNYDWQPTFSLPVIQGGDVVGGKVVVRSLSDDSILATPQVQFYQHSNGTFAFTMPRLDDELNQRAYLDVQYWVSPQASTDLQVHAEQPITVQTVGETSQPLTTVLRPRDVAVMRKNLGASDDADTEAISSAIKSTHNYSFTPYEDNNAQGTTAIYEKLEPALSTREILRLVGEYAANMDDANCTVARLVEILSTRGVDSNRFLNAIGGFNNDGDNSLSKVESHAWTVGNDGTDIEATPSTKGISTPPVVPYKEAPKAGGDTSLDTIVRTTVALLSLGMGGYIGVKFGPKTITASRRRRQESAAHWFDYDDTDRDVRLLSRIVFGRPGTVVDDSKLPDSITRGPARDGSARLLAVPSIGAQAVGKLITERRADGTLKLSSDSIRRLRTVVTKAERARREY